MTQINSSQKIAMLTPAEAQAGIKAGELVLIDVRTGVEYVGVHAVGAVHTPLNELDVKSITAKYTGNTICFICHGGSRGAKAAKQLLDAGYPRVANVVGGTDEWINSGLPVDRKKVISLERQVRIVAGLIVFIGAILAFFVHPYFVGICAFVGGGLTFAGITDFCGMGLMLAKMPWNRNLAGNIEPKSACSIS